MKKTLTLALISSTFLSISAFGKDEVLKKIYEEVGNKTVFSQAEKKAHCPLKITIKETDAQKEGEKDFFFSAQDGDFTFEGQYLSYILGSKEGKTYSNRDLDIGGYSKSTRSVSKGVLTNTYSSVTVYGTSSFKVQYDSNRSTITYNFDGNGVEPVECVFTKN